MSMKDCEYCFEKEKNCVCHWNTCAECGARIPDSHASEYRGRVWCEGKHGFEEQVAKRDWERSEVMTEENHKLAPLKDLSFGDSVVGRANREILKPQLEIARKESYRMKSYEGRI